MVNRQHLRKPRRISICRRKTSVVPRPCNRPFKLGDTEFYLNNYSNAIRSYKTLITNYINNTTIKSSLINQALYQMLRASIYLNDIKSAEESISLLLKYYPDDDFSQKGLLLMGQALNRIDKPEKARILLEEFNKKFPSSPLIPQVNLAIAKSFIKEGNFSTAAKYYDDWFTIYATNSPQPEAEFDRAFAHYQANQETNAFLIFTQFIEKYPTNNLAALARLWIGQFHYKHRDFTNAEAQFQLIFQNTNFQNSVVAYQARMMAGRAAFARQGFKDAADYFRSLINDEKCPEDIVIEALFALEIPLLKKAVQIPRKRFSSLMKQSSFLIKSHRFTLLTILSLWLMVESQTVISNSPLKTRKL
jgi:TolA-binding protein